MQAYYNKQEGVKKLTTETGAGQWGASLAFASSVFGMECEVWQASGDTNLMSKWDCIPRMHIKALANEMIADCFFLPICT